MRTIVRRATAESWQAMPERLAAERGIATPTAEDLRRLDRAGPGKRLSNTEWMSPSDPEARIARLKDTRTRLAYKPEHAIDLDTGAVVAAQVHPGDATGVRETLGKAEAALAGAGAGPTPETPAELIAGKGYHARALLKRLDRGPWQTRITESKRQDLLRWHDDAPRRLQQLRAAALRRSAGGARAESHPLRARLRPPPRPRRPAPDLAQGAREHGQALPDPRRRRQLGAPDERTHRLRDAEGGRRGPTLPPCSAGTPARRSGSSCSPLTPPAGSSPPRYSSSHPTPPLCQRLAKITARRSRPAGLVPGRPGKRATRPRPGCRRRRSPRRKGGSLPP